MAVAAVAAAAAPIATGVSVVIIASSASVAVPSIIPVAVPPVVSVAVSMTVSTVVSTVVSAIVSAIVSVIVTVGWARATHDKPLRRQPSGNAHCLQLTQLLANGQEGDVRLADEVIGNSSSRNGKQQQSLINIVHGQHASTHIADTRLLRRCGIQRTMNQSYTTCSTSPREEASPSRPSRAWLEWKPSFPRSC